MGLLWGDGSKFDSKTGLVRRCTCNRRGGGRCNACEKKRKFDDRKYAERDARNAAEDAAFIPKNEFEREALRRGWKPHLGCFKVQSSWLCGKCPDCLRKMSQAFTVYVPTKEEVLQFPAIEIEEGSGHIIDINNPSMWACRKPGEWFRDPKKAVEVYLKLRDAEATRLETEAARFRSR